MDPLADKHYICEDEDCVYPVYGDPCERCAEHYAQKQKQIDERIIDPESQSLYPDYFPGDSERGRSHTRKVLNADVYESPQLLSDLITRLSDRHSRIPCAEVLLMQRRHPPTSNLSETKIDTWAKEPLEGINQAQGQDQNPEYQSLFSNKAKSMGMTPSSISGHIDSTAIANQQRYLKEQADLGGFSPILLGGLGEPPYLNKERRGEKRKRETIE
jgi:hypothetical protein